VFDKAILKNGQEIPLNNVAIRRLLRRRSRHAKAGADVDAMGGMGASAAGSGMAGGRGALGGVRLRLVALVGAVTNTAAKHRG